MVWFYDPTVCSCPLPLTSCSCFFCLDHSGSQLRALKQQKIHTANKMDCFCPFSSPSWLILMADQYWPGARARKGMGTSHGVPAVGWSSTFGQKWALKLAQLNYVLKLLELCILRNKKQSKKQLVVFCLHVTHLTCSWAD